jgi:hypothetical protein
VNRSNEAILAGLGTPWTAVVAGPEEPHAASATAAVRAADAKATQRLRGLVVLRAGFILAFLEGREGTPVRLRHGQLQPGYRVISL